MKTKHHDEDLRVLLRTLDQVKPVRNPAFRTEVWARIESRRQLPATWAAWLRLHLAGFSLAAAASVILAAGAGGWAATARVGREREAMVARYVASIDPHRQAVNIGVNSR
ncbi:hypothetical protein IMCC26134_04655 [Verrucomicrobia bacterium IMCC26134]|jgi:hypothetical protein|nr:hypothetical protein IMCC26134_04655 [Verrucomicrobia bacterium IMCC26134]